MARGAASRRPWWSFRPYPTCTKMSGQWPGFGNTGHVFVSPTTRLLAAEKNPIVDPSALMSGSVLASFACAPPLSTLTRTVSPVSRSYEDIGTLTGDVVEE